MSVLQSIVERTRRDVAARRRARPIERVERDLAASSRDFAAALRAEGLQLIAEFKPASPSRGPLRDRDEVESFARLYEGRAAAMSVLCDRPHFDGGFDLLERARAVCDLPLLCKDFVVDSYQVAEARAAGADAVLLMASVLSDDDIVSLRDRAARWSMASLIEVHDEHELERALRLDVEVLGVNARNLHDLSIDHAHLSRLVAAVPEGPVVVAESGVSERRQVEALPERVDAVLVGSVFMESPDPAATLEALGW